jgi:hypothetical protein
MAMPQRLLEEYHSLRQELQTVEKSQQEQLSLDGR